MALTAPQVALLKYLNEEDGPAACERVCHPNTARTLEKRKLLTIDDGDGGFRPWFDCEITDAGREALAAATFRLPRKVPKSSYLLKE